MELDVAHCCWFQRCAAISIIEPMAESWSALEQRQPSIAQVDSTKSLGVDGLIRST